MGRNWIDKKGLNTLKRVIVVWEEIDSASRSAEAICAIRLPDDVEGWQGPTSNWAWFALLVAHYYRDCVDEEGGYCYWMEPDSAYEPETAMSNGRGPRVWCDGSGIVVLAQTRTGAEHRWWDINKTLYGLTDDEKWDADELKEIGVLG